MLFLLGRAHGPCSRNKRLVALGCALRWFSGYLARPVGKLREAAWCIRLPVEFDLPEDRAWSSGL